MLVMILLSMHLAAGQGGSIGSALESGTALVYESDGAAQAPWIYELVQSADREGFERCVRIERRGQPARETCLRDGLLFEPDQSGQFRAVRPIGPRMTLEVKAASGRTMLFETGARGTRQIGDAALEYVATTMTTRNTDGAIVRRLREEYAPALLTALRGEFEEPDGAGGWRAVRTFALVEIRRQP